MTLFTKTSLAMCRMLLALCLLVTSASFAQTEPKMQLRFGKGSSLPDVLNLYAKASNRRIWVEIGVYGMVEVESTSEMATTEGLAFIRKTLLENHGIELRDNATGETFVSWSQDPKYKERQRLTRTTEPLPPNPNNRRIRVLNPK